MPVGGGACAGARLVLGCPAATPATAPEGLRCGASRGRGAVRGLGQTRRTAATVHAESEWGLRATRIVTDSLAWALEDVPALAHACERYRLNAPHRHDPLRNGRVARKHLLDLADVEVMLCYFKNYQKLRKRFGDGPLPSNACPSGWTRRAPPRCRKR